MFSVERMELARKRRRLANKELAASAKISPVTLSRIRNGVQAPDEETQGKIIQALGFPSEFFYSERTDPIDPKDVSFRSLTSMRAVERCAATSSGEVAFLVSDWLNTRYNLPRADVIDWGQERDPQRAARALRQHWGLGEKPISNMVRLLEAKGVRVFSLCEDTKRVDAFSVWRGEEPYVFLNTFKTSERSRFDAAHELGHLVLHRHGGSNQGREAEHQANAFASSFLMPSADVLAKIPRVTRLSQVVKAKSRWGVSVAALSYRLHKLEIMSDWQYRSFCIQIQRNFGTSEPHSLPREKSTIWKRVFQDLWRDGRSRDQIAHDLHLPTEELNNILFGLVEDNSEPTPREKRPSLKVVR